MNSQYNICCSCSVQLRPQLSPCIAPHLLYDDPPAGFVAVTAKSTKQNLTGLQASKKQEKKRSATFRIFKMQNEETPETPPMVRTANCFLPWLPTCDRRVKAVKLVTGSVERASCGREMAAAAARRT